MSSLNFEQFNVEIGLPNGHKILQYQTDLVEDYLKHRYVIVNKSRKIGISEITLRIVLYLAFHECTSYQIMVVSANEQLALELMKRLRKLCDKIKILITEQNAHKIILYNNTELLSFPASVPALSGWARVKCIFCDEAAKFPLLDDSEIFDALSPNLANTNGYYFIVSTPHGKRGTFYKLWNNEESPFRKVSLPYTISYGLLLSEEYIARERKNPSIDFAQEYQCQFTTTQSAAIPIEEIRGAIGNFKCDLQVST